MYIALHHLLCTKNQNFISLLWIKICNRILGRLIHIQSGNLLYISFLYNISYYLCTLVNRTTLSTVFSKFGKNISALFP